jgi:mannose-6-phosphate isomerase-like protein (cupin superfamily)
MTSRREALFALAAFAAAGSARSASAEDGKPVMHSTVFEWESLRAEPTRVGSVRHVFQQPTATLDELECHVTTLNPGASPHPAHTHPDEELIIVREGTIESSMNGVSRRAGPGSILFHASNEPHTVKNVGDGPATYHVIKWNSPGMLKKG